MVLRNKAPQPTEHFAGSGRVLSAIIFAFLMVACRSSPDPVEQEPKVYRTLLLQLGAHKARKLVVRASSSLGGQGFIDMARLGIEDETLKKSFKLVNAQPSAVPWGKTGIDKLGIVSDNEVRDIFRDERPLKQSWKAFYRRYPGSGGLIAVSRVGFDAGAEKAVVYLEIRCGALCGTGNIAYFKKGLFGWKLEKLEELWVS